MLRTLTLIPLSVVITLLFFYALASLSTLEVNSFTTTDQNTHFDFLSVRDDSETQMRQRQKPPEPHNIINVKKPKTPKVSSQASFAIDSETNTIATPNLDLNLALSVSNIGLGQISSSLPSLDFDKNPRIINRISPRYPRRAIRRKLEGTVSVNFMVTKTGSVLPGSIKVIKATPPGIFESAVIQALYRWRFAIRKKNGSAISYLAQQSLHFKLD
jgi:protein TonB